MGKSWFYLTLWRGTPPDFTSELEAGISDTDSTTAVIATAENADALIEIQESATAQICKSDEANAEIITETGVIWVVG